MKDFANVDSILGFLRDGKMLPPGNLIEWSTVPEAVIVQDARFIATHSLACSKLPRASVAAIHARSDDIVEAKHVEGWASVSLNKFTFKTIEGTHYFFIKPPAEFFQFLHEFALAPVTNDDVEKDDKCVVS